MPSSLIVRCVPIKNVRPHPDADNLLIIDIMGWQVCTHKDTEPVVGDLRVFIPPDAILPQELAEKLDVVKYLKKGNRVGQVNLRGEMSFGIAATNDWDFKNGQEVSEELGITKYVPPPKTIPGDQACDHPSFPNYVDVENFRNFPDEFQDGEDVAIFEKIEGTNGKVGGIRTSSPFVEFMAHCEILQYDSKFNEMEQGPENILQYMVGSHGTRKKFSVDANKAGLYEVHYVSKVKKAIKSIVEERSARSVVFYTEIFGNGVPNGMKSMNYGYQNGEKTWRLLDIRIDGKFVDLDDLLELAKTHDLPTAPMLYRGPYSLDKLKECANQKTSLMSVDPHLSEGVVIRPAKERRYDNNNRRLLLKYKSLEYETMKAKGKVKEVAADA